MLPPSINLSLAAEQTYIQLNRQNRQHKTELCQQHLSTAAVSSDYAIVQYQAATQQAAPLTCCNLHTHVIGEK
jgi:hypothetical protein